MNLQSASKDQLQQWAQQLQSEYETIKAKKLGLDLTRGKPSTEQLSLSDAMDGILKGNYLDASGTDVRNYGGLDGIQAARELGAEMTGVPAANVLAAGNSSLTLMHQAMSIAYLYGLNGPESAWNKQESATVICPVPGYDRHYGVCEHLGIDMVTVGMDQNGPDMDAVEKLIKEDDSIVGLWCVPRFSNPTGVVYSDEVVERIAKLANIANPNFRVFWDNAYAVHALSDDAPQLLNIWQACQAAGTEDSVLQFASTSKITFAGAGVAFMAASDANLKGFKKSLAFMTIGPDKVNQLRHVEFFKADGALTAHMNKHADIIRPRFDSVLRHLEAAFGDNELGTWESAQGGYFISFDTQPGLAKEVVQLAADAGVKLTPAGATFPYGKDPKDSNIRIAPTVPTVEQVDEAMKVFVCCVKLASVKQALTQA
ncbi:aminotransferase class I/II-fold pyridoxal phosphate-dependent enzyme [Agaribacterium haliotis]|uniref:aminotransferase class I/II-fold pyridoxal phosphate-dependent enzyme n=1 Tax=Agaribacterium haliotis TaxID=2013869 RepID=UPI000BB534B1|nr:aminotransferase class I/II-fold pyridoxal phosphate-dependent enzyme [Agaribacterium haliotis]